MAGRIPQGYISSILVLLYWGGPTATTDDKGSQRERRIEQVAAPQSIFQKFHILQVIPLAIPHSGRRAPPTFLRIFGQVWSTLPAPVNPTTAIDLHWTGHPRAIAAALLASEDSNVLIDPGPASTFSTLQEQLGHLGLKVDDLDAVLLTHIHLDHAGATGLLVRENPHLPVYVHSRGASHMADPAKLLQSAFRLYGDDMQRLYGEFLPVPAANLRVLEGGETLSLGTRRLQVLYTPGHASHHVTYYDLLEGVAFVGDTAGISINGHPFVLPATPPPDISLELWETSLDAIANLHPKKLFLTHFSFSHDPMSHIANYRESLHRWRDLSARILASNLDEHAAMHRFAKEVGAEAAQVLSPEQIAEYVFSGALSLSWLGMVRYHRKRAEALAQLSPK